MAMVRPLVRKRWWDHPWRRWTWWEIRNIQKQQQRLADSLDEAIGDSDLVQGLVSEMAISVEQIEQLRNEALITSAKFWRVFVPRYGADGWTKQNRSKLQVLSPEFGDRVRNEIWQQKVVLLGFVFGIASIVQAVFAVLEYCRN